MQSALVLRDQEAAGLHDEVDAALVQADVPDVAEAVDAVLHGRFSFRVASIIESAHARAWALVMAPVSRRHTRG